MDETNLCRFLGYLFGDGSLKVKKVKGDKKTQVEAEIECADRVVVEDFASICQKLLKRNVGSIRERKRNKNWRTTYTFSCKINKKFQKHLFSLSPTFRTKPHLTKKGKVYPTIRLPEIIYKRKENTTGFLKSITNSEGSIQLRVSKHGKWFELMRFVKISCSHPLLLQEISKCLDTLGIENRLAPKNSPVSVIIQKKNSVRKFQKKVNFLEGIKVSNNGRWKGIYKSSVLSALIDSYNIPRGKLQNFKTKEEVYKFLIVNYFPEMDSETRIQVLRYAAGAKIPQCTQV